jgi:hypothetical protein
MKTQTKAPSEYWDQVMPWPTLRNMTDQDLEAIYEYLRCIPSVP